MRSTTRTKVAINDANEARLRADKEARGAAPIDPDRKSSAADGRPVMRRRKARD